MTRFEDVLPEAAQPHYIPPRHNVLLLSCMDPRLIDDLSAFMHRDNLTNRFDHVILAGASLGVSQTKYPHWRETFFEHLELSVALHDIKDIYLVEHRHCGAYKHFLGLNYEDTPDDQRREELDHAEQAFALRDEIHHWADTRTDATGAPLKLRIYCFLMDLRGHTKLLSGPTDEPTIRRKAAPKKKPSSRRGATGG